MGSKAPDFTVNAYIKGESKSITLSDYREKWVVLIFYSGDFSFT